MSGTDSSDRDRSLSSDLATTAGLTASLEPVQWADQKAYSEGLFEDWYKNQNPNKPDTNYKSNTVTPLDIPASVHMVIPTVPNVAPVVVPRGGGRIVDYVSSDAASKDTNYVYKSTPIAVKDGSTGKVVYFEGYYSLQKPRTKSDKPAPLPIYDPSEYKWNLPPHEWSRPLSVYADKNFMPSGVKKGEPNDRYRRGRIWWGYSDPNLSVYDTNGDYKVTKGDDEFRKYGFQFIWNPDRFNTQVAVSMDATPNSNDAFLSGVGAFPATETITFNIMLDRTNDFACANAKFSRPSGVKVGDPNVSSHFISEAEVKSLSKYYTGGFGATTANIRDLFERGTIADIEYLYRAINGAGPSGNRKWKNGRGTVTADIGFLMPSLLNIDIGPLSYKGYVTNLGVVHTAFTRDMIPIRSEVSISLNLLATAGMTSTFAQQNATK